MAKRAGVWLFIDTHKPGESRIAWFEKEKPVRIVYIKGRAAAVLPTIAKTWNKRVAGICVVAGPGSFSSVRAGVLQANLMSRLLRIPLVGITVAESHDLPVLAHRLLATRYALRTSRYVAPIYDQEPNIAIPKPA